MATQLQLRRGTTSETGSFTGAVGEVTVDTTKDTLVVHDGSTAGGFEMAKADGSNIEKLSKSGATKIATTSSGISVTGGNSGTNIDIASFTSATGALNINCSDLSAANPTWTLRTFSGEPIAFAQGTDERVRISSAGDLLVGTTNNLPANSNVQGIALSAGSFGGRLEASRSGGAPVSLNRVDSNGSIIELRQGGANVGFVGTFAGGTYIGNGDTGIRFSSNLDAVIPVTSVSGAGRGSAISLGYVSGGTVFDFKDLYLSGGVYLGGTGAANKLDDYEEGTWTAVHGGQNMGTTGRYTKVGQMVTLVLDATSHPSATSSSSISGLPFAITSSHSAFNVGYTDSAAGLTGGYCNVNNSTLAFTVSGGISGRNLGASERVMLTATYVTTA